MLRHCHTLRKGCQQADFPLIELGTELVEVVEMRRFILSIILNSYLNGKAVLPCNGKDCFSVMI